MTTDQLQLSIRAEPFRPFTLRQADSRGLHIPHREFIAHKPGGRTAFVYSETEDAGELIDLLLVVRIDYTTGTTSKPKGRKP